MKHITFVLLISSFALTASAQNFEFGLNGGIVRNSIHDGYSGVTYANFTQFQSSVIAPVVSARVMSVMAKYQFGLAVESKTITYKGIYAPEIAPTIEPPTTSHFIDHETGIKLFMNRVIHFSKLEAYGGLSVEYILSNVRERTDGSSNRFSGTYMVGQNRPGADIHIGATYFITKHLGINVEIAGEYTHYPSGPLDKNVFSYPATIGVRYKLH